MEQITQAANYIRQQTRLRPQVCLVLGTGLGALVQELTQAQQIAYADIPYFTRTTAPSHAGMLCLGHLDQVPLFILHGRFHYYEGLSLTALTLPIRVMHQLGVRTLLLSNAAGGLTPNLSAGSLCLVEDHINLLPSPLRGPNIDAMGPRFADMFQAYCPVLRKHMLSVAQKQHLTLHSGIYAAVPGPQLETPAEYEYLRRIGAHLVGMSTVPEVIVARHMGMRCCALSVITDTCYGAPKPLELQEVLDHAQTAEPQLNTLIRRFVADGVDFA